MKTNIRVSFFTVIAHLIQISLYVWCLQKEEGLIQGQLNHSDSKQYINELRDQITELKNEVRLKVILTIRPVDHITVVFV